MTLTDEMLLRYADGTLSSAEARAVEQLLEGDEVAAERLRFLHVSGKALVSAREHDLASAPVERVLALVGKAAPPVPRQRTVRPSVATGEWMRPWRTAAGIALFAAGLALGMTYAPKDEGPGPMEQVASAPEMAPAAAGKGGWIERVVEYQALYSRATVEPVHVYPGNLPEIESRLASALGAPMHIPDLTDANLEFREGRQLEYNGKTIVQLVYLPKTEGKPVALCAIKKKVDDFAPRFLTEYSLGIVQWASGGVEFLLVGSQPREELVTAAYKAQKQL